MMGFHIPKLAACFRSALGVSDCNFLLCHFFVSVTLLVLCLSCSLTLVLRLLLLDYCHSFSLTLNLCHFMFFSDSLSLTFALALLFLSDCHSCSFSVINSSLLLVLSFLCLDSCSLFLSHSCCVTNVLCDSSSLSLLPSLSWCLFLGLLHSWFLNLLL